MSRHGHAFIDRALYLPKGWTDDPARLKTTYVPDDVSFSTKPQLAAEMIEGALLGINSNHWFASWGKPQRVIGTAEEIAKTQQRSDWRRSVGRCRNQRTTIA